jgi:hypothetical protein
MGIVALSIIGSLIGFALAGNSKGEWAGFGRNDHRPNAQARIATICFRKLTK